MEHLIANFVTRGRVRHETLNGREYVVAPLSLIVPGVLNGSKGALFYPESEVSSDPTIWNHVPIVVYHPTHNGMHISARDPGILEKQGIGVVLHSRFDGKLRAEGWFDVAATRRVDNRVWSALERGAPIELSTGLYTDNEPAPLGANHNGRGYDFIARNYRPDHLAVLPDQVGACSINDGCGVLVNDGLTSVSNATSGPTNMDQVNILQRFLNWLVGNQPRHQETGQYLPQSGSSPKQTHSAASKGYTGTDVDTIRPTGKPGVEADEEDDHDPSILLRDAEEPANEDEIASNRVYNRASKLEYEIQLADNASPVDNANQVRDELGRFAPTGGGISSKATKNPTKTKEDSDHRSRMHDEASLHGSGKYEVTRLKFGKAPAVATVLDHDSATSDTDKADFHAGMSRVHRESAAKAEKAGNKDLASAHKQAAKLHTQYARQAQYRHGSNNSEGPTVNPFVSEDQRRYMWANHPEIAHAWAHGEHTSDSGHKMPDESGEGVAGKDKTDKEAADKRKGKSKSAVASNVVKTGKVDNQGDVPESEGDIAEAPTSSTGNPASHTSESGKPKKPKKTPAAAFGSAEAATRIEGIEPMKVKMPTANEFESDDQRKAFFGLKAGAKDKGGGGEKGKSGGSAKEEEGGKSSAASDASAKAIGASKRANQSGSGKLHEEAAAAHTAAGKAHKEAGNHEAAEKHFQTAASHDRSADSYYSTNQQSALAQTAGNDMENDMPDPHDASKQAAGASVASEHQDARGPAMDAMDASGDGDHGAAASAHKKAAGIHDKAATESRKNGDEDAASDHDMAAMMHRKAASMHTASATMNSRATRNQRVSDMTREQLIGHLSANCSCEGDRASLNSLSDDTLRRLAWNAKPDSSNADETGSGEDQAGGEEDTNQDDYESEDEFSDKVKIKKGGKMSSNQWLASAPPEIREAVNNSVQIVRREQVKLVQLLIANVQDDNRRKAMAQKLMKKSLGELRDLVGLLPLQHRRAVHNQGGEMSDTSPLYLGANPPLTSNTSQDDKNDILPLPTMNWEEAAAEQRQAEQGRR